MRACVSERASERVREWRERGEGGQATFRAGERPDRVLPLGPVPQDGQGAVHVPRLEREREKSVYSRSLSTPPLSLRQIHYLSQPDGGIQHRYAVGKLSLSAGWWNPGQISYLSHYERYAISLTGMVESSADTTQI